MLYRSATDQIRLRLAGGTIIWTMWVLLGLHDYGSQEITWEKIDKYLHALRDPQRQDERDQ
jgi:hypothetical protein